MEEESDRDRLETLEQPVEGQAKTTQSKKSRSKKPKPVSAAYLERAALHYLGRFSATEQGLRDVLTRKIARRKMAFGPLSDEENKWLDQIIAKCVRYGYVDDARYAESKWQSLVARGKPLRQISMELKRRGVPDDVIEALVAQQTAHGDEAETLNIQAALNYARRRRLGPYAVAGRPAKDPEKQIAAMARAGFAPGLAVRIVKAASIEELESLLSDEDAHRF